MDGEAWKAAVHGVAEGQTWLSNFTFTFHFHSLEKKMATHSSVLAWRISGTGEPGGLPSMGSHRVRHNWSDSARLYFQICSRCDKHRLKHKYLGKPERYIRETEILIRKSHLSSSILFPFSESTKAIYPKASRIGRWEPTSNKYPVWTKNATCHISK